jgi:hypothetical protein
MLVRKEDIEKLDVRLCPRCLARYMEPCAVVVVEEGANGVWHIVLIRYLQPQFYGPVVYTTMYEAVRRCGGRKWRGGLIPARDIPGGIGLCRPLVHVRSSWRKFAVMGHSALVDEEFVVYLLGRYPALHGELLTEHALRKAGCDLEAEIAMWQLCGSA